MVGEALSTSSRSTNFARSFTEVIWQQLQHMLILFAVECSVLSPWSCAFQSNQITGGNKYEGALVSSGIKGRRQTDLGWGIQGVANIVCWHCMGCSPLPLFCQVTSISADGTVELKDVMMSSDGMSVQTAGMKSWSFQNPTRSNTDLKLRLRGGYHSGGHPYVLCCADYWIMNHSNLDLGFSRGYRNKRHTIKQIQPQIPLSAGQRGLYGLHLLSQTFLDQCRGCSCCCCYVVASHWVWSNVCRYYDSPKKFQIYNSRYSLSRNWGAESLTKEQ